MRLKNEVTVGVVVVLALVVLVIGAFWLSGRPFGEEQMDLVGIFREAGELREGNPVKYRGVQVGRVTEIALSEDGRGVLVTMQVQPGLSLPPQPAVVLSPASLFGDWQAELVSLPTLPDLEFTFAEGVEATILPGATLPDITELTAVGARIANQLETIAGRVDIAFTEETAIKIRETIENIQEISQQLTGFVEQQTRTYQGVSQNVLAATRNIEEATEAVQRAAGGVEGQIPEIVENARLASANLQELSVALEQAAAGVPGLVSRVDTTLANVNRVTAGLGEVIEEVQPQIRQIGPTLTEARQALATLQRASARIEQGEGTLGRLLEDPALYEETQAAVATLRRVLADLQAHPERYIGAIQIF